MKLNSESVVKRNPGVLSSKLDEEYVMLSLENNEYYGFDEIASVIWDKLEQEITVSRLISELLEEFEVERETCEKDVLELLEILKNKALINYHD